MITKQWTLALVAVVAIIGAVTMVEQWVNTQVKIKERATDPAPQASIGQVYSREDGKLYFRNSAGEITELTGTGTGPAIVAGFPEIHIPASLIEDDWTPRIHLPDGYRDLYGDGKRLQSELIVGASEAGTAILDMQAEYWLDRVRQVTSSQWIAGAWRVVTYEDSVFQAIESNEVVAPEVFASNVEATPQVFQESIIRMDLTTLEFLDWGDETLSLFSPGIASGSVIIRFAKDSWDPALPNNETEYDAITRTSASVTVEAEDLGDPIDISDLIAELESALGAASESSPNAFLLILTPGMDGTDMTLDSTAPAQVLLTGESTTPGPQGKFHEGDGIITDDPQELTPLEVPVDLPDADPYRQVYRQQWPGFTPGDGRFEFADDVTVRLKIKQQDDEGTLGNGNVDFYTIRLTMAEPPTYGYGD